MPKLILYGIITVLILEIGNCNYTTSSSNITTSKSCNPPEDSFEFVLSLAINLITTALLGYNYLKDFKRHRSFSPVSRIIHRNHNGSSV
ncbi:E3 10 kDa protein [California sea lion adenovirus 1]|uniref:E3 10 kDa protein n=1 Tax=California sea lion adenovirus 1 TaxID=943083 RepID=A0A059XDH8_9ADEN|nr:E3 10 kDa protein [California sea lion adenovirus 1]AIA22365.1 E3 10 kDa protein [California sea lion adenovirus 1]